MWLKKKLRISRAFTTAPNVKREDSQKGLMEQSKTQETQVILRGMCILKRLVFIFMSTWAWANLNTAAQSSPDCNTGSMASMAKQVLFEIQRLIVVSISSINLYLKTGLLTAEISGEQMVEWICSNESQGYAPCFNTLIMNIEKKSPRGLWANMGSINM